MSGRSRVSDALRPSASIAERRAIETIDRGTATTGFKKFGARVRIQMSGPDGQSLFGAIDQTISRDTRTSWRRAAAAGVQARQTGIRR